MSKKKFNKTLSDMINDNTFDHYNSYLSLLAKSMFEWVNLPKSVNEKYLEYCLFNFGKCVFYDDKDLGYLCLKAHSTNLYNVYREPIGVRAEGENGHCRDLKDGEFVIIRNNDDEIPTRNSIEMFAYRLYDAQRTADTNVFLHKIPYIILCEEKELLSMKKVIEKIGSNEVAIYGLKNGTLMENIQVKETKVPLAFNEIMDYKNIVWNECMTFLGIQNANMDKKERLITNEVEANDEQIRLSAKLMLKTRELACEEINKMFNLNISVKPREDFEYLFNEEEGEFDDVPENESHDNVKNVVG